LYTLICIIFPITVRLLQNNERGFPLIFTITVVVQRLLAARATLAKQRWTSAQEFCVGLADPCVHDLAFSGAKLCLALVERA
jgi:hypothetical protein